MFVEMVHPNICISDIINVLKTQGNRTPIMVGFCIELEVCGKSLGSPQFKAKEYMEIICQFSSRHETMNCIEVILM